MDCLSFIISLKLFWLSDILRSKYSLFACKLVIFSLHFSTLAFKFSRICGISVKRNILPTLSYTLVLSPRLCISLSVSWALGKRPVDTIANGSRINTCQHFHIGTLISHSQIPFTLNNSCISRNSWEKTEIIFWCDCTVRNMCVAFTSVCQNVRCLY